MKLNTGKSKIIFVPKNKQGSRGRYMKGSVDGIMIVHNAKYLGIILDRNLSFNKQVEKWSRDIFKFRKKFRMLKYHERD